MCGGEEGGSENFMKWVYNVNYDCITLYNILFINKIGLGKYGFIDSQINGTHNAPLFSVKINVDVLCFSFSFFKVMCT